METSRNTTHFQSLVKNKKLSAQSKEIINSVLQFMRKEADGVTIALGKVQERVSAATGVSVRTIRNISNEYSIIQGGAQNQFLTLKRIRKKTQTEWSDSNVKVLQHTARNFYLTEKELPTLNRLRKKLNDKIGYSGSKESLRKELHRIGFCWKNSKTHGRILVEQHDINNPSSKVIMKCETEQEILQEVKTDPFPEHI